MAKLLKFQLHISLDFYKAFNDDSLKQLKLKNQFRCISNYVNLPIMGHVTKSNSGTLKWGIIKSSLTAANEWCWYCSERPLNTVRFTLYVLWSVILRTGEAGQDLSSKVVSPYDVVLSKDGLKVSHSINISIITEILNDLQ